jgi:PAS domain S-box-containing protein
MVSATPIMSAAGHYDGSFGMLTDITERKKVEAELSEYHCNLEQLVEKRTAELNRLNQELQGEIKQRRLLFSAVEHLVEGVIITDIHGIVQYVNPSFERIRGYSRTEIIGQPIHILISGQDKKALVQKIMATFRKGKTYVGRLKGRRKDGILLDLEMNISPIQNYNGAITNYVAIEHDLTQQVELERQLRQAQKMEAIGTLAGGIAHDFNNILSPIITHTEIALEDLPIASPIRSNLERVLRAGFRAAALVKQILTISRRQESARQPIQLDSLVNESVKFMRASFPSTIDIQLALEKDLGLVEADPSQIHQVLLNLFTNAGQAMAAQGGTLIISLKNYELDKTISYANNTIPAGGYLRLTVSDTGPGMTPEILERIFEPYFTTKPPGKGTGLGLAVALGIIKAHNGLICVDSKVGKGTIFRIFLPRIESVPVAVVHEAALIPRGRESILLVDDEEEIVAALSHILERLGYRVLAFTNSRAALERFRTQPEQYDLVISDQTMPGMTGDELAREILTIRPNLPIILCTGFSEVIDEDKARLLGIKGFLMKPMTRDKLAVAVRQALSDKQN